MPFRSWSSKLWCLAVHSFEWQCDHHVRSYLGRLRRLLWIGLALVAPLRSRCWVLQIYPTVVSQVPPHELRTPPPPTHTPSSPMEGGEKILFLFLEPNRKGRDDLKSSWDCALISNRKCPLTPLPFLKRKSTNKEGGRPCRVQSSTQRNETKQDLPGGVVDKNPPANQGHMGLAPGPGRSHNFVVFLRAAKPSTAETTAETHVP